MGVMTTSTSFNSLSAPTPCSREVHEPAGLASLVETPVQMVTWDRPTDPRVVRFARDVLAQEPFEMCQSLSRDAIGSFDPLPEFAQAADPEAASRFVEDVRFLAGLFVELTSTRTFGLRLVCLDEAMCPRFHTDFILVRLLFTYCGTGTEWLADADVDRRYLGKGNGGLPDAESGLLRPGAVVREVPEQTLALLKGAAWPGNEKKGAIHRSPSLGEGEQRVLLSLDVVE